MHALILNPNTTASVTARLEAAALARWPARISAIGATARFGAPYIACETSFALAAAAVVDTWARHPMRPALQGVLVGCFGDPGYWALQEASGLPVAGLAEASFEAAAARGRFAIVTGGARWRPTLERVAVATGHAPLLAGIDTVTATGAQLAADPALARAVLGDACRRALEQWQPDAIIIGGAGLAGMAASLQADCAVPLIDSVDAGLDALAQRMLRAPVLADAPAAVSLAWLPPI